MHLFYLFSIQKDAYFRDCDFFALLTRKKMHIENSDLCRYLCCLAVHLLDKTKTYAKIYALAVSLTVNFLMSSFLCLQMHIHCI